MPPTYRSPPWPATPEKTLLLLSTIARELAACFLELNLYQMLKVIYLHLLHFYGLLKSSQGSVICDAPSCGLAGTISPAHLRHSQDFVSHVRGVSPATMMSLDVTFLTFLYRKLPTKDPCLPRPTDVFLQLICLWVESNSFFFAGCFYFQTFGFAISSPFSPVLANLFMEFFDSELFPSMSIILQFGRSMSTTSLLSGLMILLCSPISRSSWSLSFLPSVSRWNWRLTTSSPSWTC